MTPLQKVHEYAAAVRSGELLSCQMIRLAVDRWYADWGRDDIFFDPRPLKLFVAFCKELKHYKGAKAGAPLEWEPWQLFAAANILCWKRRDTKRRRFTYADIYVPRKNGKTTFAAAIADFMLLLDGEAAAEVYAAAVDKAQAKICFDSSWELLKGSRFGQYVQHFRKGSIVFEETASVYKPLSKDTKNKDGLNIHCGICDERHAWKTNEIYEVLKTGIGARSQPLIFSISTAGTDMTYPYYEDLCVYREMMKGIRELPDNHFFMLYEPDEGDDWTQESTWRKCNPNYGVSLSRKYMEDECKEALDRGGTIRAAFLTKNLNKWVDAPKAWLKDEVVAANNAPFDEHQLEGEVCYVGLDLAATKDITATALFFPRFNIFKYLFVVPEAKLQEDNGVQDIVDYRRWVEEGWLTVCPGQVLSQDWFLDFLLAKLAPYKVKKIALDPWNAWELKAKLSLRYNEDDVVTYEQTMKYMYPPTKKLDEWLTEGKVNLLGNPVIRWMFGNVVLYHDPGNLNYRPSKGQSKKKIDGVVASIDALGTWLSEESSPSGAVYTTHSLRTLNGEGLSKEQLEEINNWNPEI